MRKVTFTNANSVDTVFSDDTDYKITLLEGLSTPALINQDQKAPFQDGTTFLDTLLDVREITLEGAVNKPKNLAAINTAKDTLIKNLRPKLGPGWLKYEASGGVVKRIQCVPDIVFNNKDAQEPFQKFQVIFRCNDPYWKSLSDSSISLPTVTTGAESPINSAASAFPCVIQKSNGNLFVVYRRTSDTYLVSREYTTSWGAETVINSAVSSYPYVIQKSNGNLFLVYVAASGLVSREYTTSWSSETVITTNAATPSIIQKSNGNILLLYRTPSINGALVSREYTTSWGGATTVTSATLSTPSVAGLLKKPNGNILTIYKRDSDGYLVSKELDYTTSTWGPELNVSNNGIFPSVSIRANGIIDVFYASDTTGYLMTRNFNLSWSSEAAITSTATAFPSVIFTNTGNLFIVYINGSTYLVSKTRGVTPVVATVTGHTSTPMSITFNGPSVNPTIVKNSTLEYIRINKSLAAGDSFVINTAFGQKTVSMISGGISVNGMAYLDIGSKFFNLDPGSNVVYFEDSSDLSTATATMTWGERYVGC